MFDRLSLAAGASWIVPSRMSWMFMLAASAAAWVAGPALAAEPECFDTQVTAEIARQTPIVAGDCGPDCIVTSWPWIVDLDVVRVHNGDMQRGPVRVLTIQHTYFGSGRRLWWLRRNTSGGFNVVGMGRGASLERCAAGTPPARPYVRPADGATLERLRLEGEGYYGRWDDGRIP